MNEEIEYAEMLEIPVSTVNVVRKKSRRNRKKDVRELPQETSKNTDLKGAVIAQVNGKLEENAIKQEPVTADAELFAECANSTGEVCFSETEETRNGEIPERIDTVRLFSAGELEDEFHAKDIYADDIERENDGGRYAFNAQKAPSKASGIVLGVEFAAACALCGAIFLTNVFMPGSAINTFFRTLENGGKTAEVTDTRTYSDFTLSGVVSDFSEVELTLSPAGILTFTEACCVYPVADGKVSAVTKETDGTYTLKISHSDTFTGVIDGLQHVYYAEGDEVKANVPVGFANGETEVQVTMYSEGELLNCFRITEENCLAWAEAQ